MDQKFGLELNFYKKMFFSDPSIKSFVIKIFSYIFIINCFFISSFLYSQNVPPVLTDKDEIERVIEERDEIFSTLISDPTNLDNLFKYANLSILLGDLEAAIGVFEQMLFYQPDLPRIRLELGVLYFRLNAYSSAQNYLESVFDFNPPEEVIEKVNLFLSAINKNRLKFNTRHLIGFGSKHATNANSGIGTDFIDVLGLRLIVNPDVKPSSDKSFVYRYSLQSVEDLRHPRGNKRNIFFSISDERPINFDNFDLSSVILSVGQDFYLERTNKYFSDPVANLSYTGSQIFLADRGLLNTHQISFQIGSKRNNDLYMGLKLNHDHRNFERNKNKSGYMNGISSVFSYEFSNNLFTSFEYSFNKFVAQIESEDYTQRLFSISLIKNFPNDYAFSFNFNQLKKNFYKASFPWPLRRDIGNTFTLNVSKLFSQCHNISIGISKSDFNSTVGLYEKKNTSTSADYAYICIGD